ncbi:EP1-like glycoprotein 2 [Aristolochia californica]|uniref:EP1-like glycoprotein 2 n=1 Tax=Aristolochia californica TaxID=171875 RepID=UPI0035DA3954
MGVRLVSCFVLCFSFLSTVSRAIVPDSQRFKYVNEGEFGEYLTEYDASYRLLPVDAFPFQLCFYNTTPNAFYLALRMGHRRSESILRWVWEANRNVPVQENATLTFGRDGNLVLANPNGRVVWSTGTANKGVVGLRLLPTGNLVLYDNKGKFLWQSFDHPTDTLLVGQSLKVGGATKLVSRVSDSDGSEGPYSFVMESGGLSMYLKVAGSKGISYTSDTFSVTGNPLSAVTFSSEPETAEAHAYELKLNLAQGGSSAGAFILGRAKYNGTLSFLKIGSDGNLRTYTYNEKVDYRAWEVTFTFFSGDGRLSGCRLPAKCGSLGVCEDEMCVACPRPQGLVGWSKNCLPPKISSCSGRFDYYKVEGVEHFLSASNDGVGPVKIAQCRDKCSKDCKCVGFTYKQESSRCLLVPVLGTLSRVENASRSVYIKIAK